MLTHFKSRFRIRFATGTNSENYLPIYGIYIGQKNYKKQNYIHSGSAIVVAKPFHKQNNIKEENYVNRKITKRLFKRS